MSSYARKAGRRKYPGHRKRMMAHANAGSPQLKKEEGGGEASRLVAIGSRIDGVVKSAISPEILSKTEGLPWHARRARLHAITGIPFAEIPEVGHGHNLN